jgi:signal peptide peptidase SppA
MIDQILALHGDVNAAMAAQRTSTTGSSAAQGIATLHVEGLLSRDGEFGGSSTNQLRRELRQFVESPDVRAVLIHVRSPGGVTAGTYELGADVAAARLRKPVVAFIEDVGASAAYWIASQAQQVFADHMALIGSIGTYTVVHDWASLFNRVGIKAHVIRAGKFKGAGALGTDITAEQIDEWQRVINSLNEHFLAAVSTGRRLPMEQVRQLADGRVHVGDEARALGLIDGTMSFDQLFSAMQKKLTPDPRQEFDNRVRAKMAQGLDAPTARSRVALEDPVLHQKFLIATNSK